MEFDVAVSELSQWARRPWPRTLDRMNEFVDRLGLRSFVTGSDRPDYFHVAGTNGKGSCIAFLQSLLVEHGISVGACVSPYVYDIRERVQIGRDLISREDFARLVEDLVEAGEAIDRESGCGPSEFEMKTALGFLKWQEVGVKAVALETGIGGRLDSTNVVDPAVSLISSIGYDHMHLLGSTLGDIAAEKAGIIKPGRPCVVGQVTEEAWDAISSRANKVEARVWRLGRDFVVEPGPTIRTPGHTWKDFELGLKGPVQLRNAALVLAGLEAAGIELEENAVRRGLARASAPGRLERVEWRGVTLIFDGGHNPQAAEEINHSLAAEFPGQRVGYAVGMLQGHDPTDFIAALVDNQAPLVCLPAPAPRGLLMEELLSKAKALRPDAQGFEHSKTGIEWLIQQGAEAIVVTGSFYLLGQVKQDLSLA